MKTMLNISKRSTLALLFLLFIQKSFAQSVPFQCDFSAYLFQTNDVYVLDLASGNSFLAASNITVGSINAAGYNSKDGYIWGFLSAPTNSICRIDKNFMVDTYTIPQLNGASCYIGDIDTNGIYYCKGGGTSFQIIDLNPSSPTYLTHLGSGTLSLNLNIHDWAFNANDGLIYTVEKSTNNLYRINASTGNVQSLGAVPILSGSNNTYGASYFDSTGNYYISDNQTGVIYIINNVQSLNGTNAISSNLFAYGPSSSSNDGARCPTAPVPQEDCTNGIDDDGDGLVDCADPSCSGVAACPVIPLVVSGGNQGGLESNDRLSSQINKRNYLRNKNNYTFDITKAPLAEKSTLAKGGEIQLLDLIPLNALSRTTAVETSPIDLINITNATELYSVDYVKNNKSVAVILATKTENGVYEHTKYICDRLLGAELLSVATMEINEHSFIRSIIKNADGNIEFVLSFSAKISNDEQNFEIESHWNLDAYEKNKSFYNFQIWANNINDLWTLGEQTLQLIEAQKSITTFNLSTPPTIFVKKGQYVNGKLELEIINSNKTKNALLDAGFKRTETSETSFLNTQIDLNQNYISNVQVETGNLFDIGFRIQDEKNGTPDDLFLSDGPWGLDDSAPTTTIEKYEVNENETNLTQEGLLIERNVDLKAQVKNYLSVYRAFTPRFQSVDLSAFNTLEFDASGNGEMEITIIKNSINNWEQQFKTTVSLQSNKHHYYLPLSHFASTVFSTLSLHDAVSIVFTLASDGQKTISKELKLENLNFKQNAVIPQEARIANSKLLISPNPMKAQSSISFYVAEETTYTFEIYSITGQLVEKRVFEANQGDNILPIQKGNLEEGIYMIKVYNSLTQYEPVKLIIQ